jgi:death-on-curing protein
MVMELHDAILDISGGRPGILDEKVIDAAIHRPKTYLSYHENCDIHTVCAVLLDSIARNHGFVEGNKRTGLMTAILTYELNGITLQSSADRTNDFEDLVLWVVLEKPEIPEIASKLEVLIKKYRSNSVSKFADTLRKLLTPFSTDE